MKMSRSKGKWFPTTSFCESGKANLIAIKGLQILDNLTRKNINKFPIYVYWTQAQLCRLL